MSFKDSDSQVEYELENAFTWGVKKDKFFDYSIPVVVSDEDAAKISGLAEENGAKDPMYGKTIYLRSKLASKHKTDLLNKGRTKILVHFKFTDINTNAKGDVRYLTHKVTKLRKLEESEDDEDVPEV